MSGQLRTKSTHMYVHTKSTHMYIRRYIPLLGGNELHTYYYGPRSIGSNQLLS